MISNKPHTLSTLILATVFLAGCKEEGPAIDQAAATRGKALVEDCKACHILDATNNMVGPHLVGIIGREVASVQNFDYSEAMLAETETWTPDRMKAFILDPIATIPGTMMAYGGITESEAHDIVEHLRYINQ